MAQQKYLIVLGGATASGKTAFAIRLAQHFRTSILSCDSRQFFKEIPIGTAAPTEEELNQASHHFIGQRSIQEPYSVGDFERDALALLEDLYEHNDLVILAGGSGLYQKALCEGLDTFPEVPPEVRQEIETLYEKDGLEALQQQLKAADPIYYEEVDLQNPHRLIRALSVIKASGQPFSSFRTQAKSSRPFRPIYIWLHRDRQELYGRINQRVELLFEQGLLKEAGAVYPFRQHTALQTVGYQELFDFFEQKTTLEEAKELIKRNSRRYAKRQLTWSRRDGFWKHFHPNEWNQCLEYLQAAMEYNLSLETEKYSDNPYPHNSLQLRSKNGLLQSIEWRSCREGILLNFPLIRAANLDNQSKNFLLHELIARHLPSPVYSAIPTTALPFPTFFWIKFKENQCPEKIQKLHEMTETKPKDILLGQLMLKEIKI